MSPVETLKMSAIDRLVLLNEVDVCLLLHSVFGGKTHSSMSLTVQGVDSLLITLWLRIEHGNHSIGTILDFSHDAASGCVLQLRSEAERTDSELCWNCSGFSLTSRVQPSQWIHLTCGYDAARRKAWMSVDGEPIMDGSVPSAPFATKEVRLGIGHWLGGHHREFHGELKDLRIAARGMDRIGPCRRPDEAIPEDCCPSEQGATISQKREAPAGKPQNVLNHFVDGIRGRAIRLRNLGGITKQCVDFFRTSQWRISVSFNNDDKADATANSVNVKRAPPAVNEHLANFVSYARREDVIGAAHYLNQLYELGCRIRISTTVLGDLDLAVTDEHEDIMAFSHELLAIDMRRFRDTPAWMLVSALVSCAQTLYRRGDLTGSRSVLMSHLKEYGSASSHFVRDVELAQSRFSEEGDRASVLVRNLAIGGLDYLEHFKGKYCNHPFDDFEIRSDGEIFVCCPSYLPYSIGNVFKVKSVDEVKSSQMLAKLKDSIVCQDFRYCRWLHCKKIKNGIAVKPEQAKTDYAPIDFRLSYDPTCNLWCPSCRTEKIVAKGEQRERFMQLTDEIVLPLLKTANSCMMNGYGDVFASRACRKILETANAEEFPNLKFDFITNGVLFTAAEWGKFPGIHHMVRSIRVSIDAARKETYDQIRLGGDWDILMNNLEFMASLRRQNIIERFMISMVIQEGNFKEMADFARMAKRLGCDFAIFEPIMNWNTFAVEEFERQAVHYSTHPRHEEFQRNLAQVFEILPLSNAQTVPKLGTPGFETLASTNF